MLYSSRRKGLAIKNTKLSYYKCVFNHSNCIQITMGNKRLTYIDIAKGIGITLVVCSHTAAYELMAWSVGFFVPIFYFCSGYTTSSHSIGHSIKYNMIMRAKKLLIPYLFFNLLLFLYFRRWSFNGLLGIIYSRYCIYPMGSTTNYDLFIWGNYPMWFITSLFISYFFYYFILYHYKYRNIIIFMYLCLTLLLSKTPILLPWSIDTAFLTSLIMLTGLYAKRNNIIEMEKWEIVICVLAYILLLEVAGEINISVRQYGISFVLYYIIATLGCITLLWCSQKLETTIIGVFFAFLGRHSLTIFCMEILFIREVSIAYCAIMNTCELDTINGLLGTITALLGGSVMSILLHKVSFCKSFIFNEKCT